MTRVIAAAVIALAAAVPATYFIRLLAIRIGAVARPKSDRWHARTVPLLGGIAIIGATLLSVAFLRTINPRLLSLIVVALLIAGVGYYDDRRSLRPSTKLVAQLVCASILVFAGFGVQLTGVPLVDAGISLVWIVGITNAFNLLDNMDGLCAGIGLIALAALVAARAVHDGTYPPELVFGGALAGSLAGFLLFNFQPASIFMGDAGSLFIGMSLAGLTTMSGAAAGSNVVTVLSIPVLILAIPIFDTAFVTVSRKLAGRPASQGGKDHTSHRLVALGFSERRAVLFLYALGSAAGVLAILVRQFGIAHVNVVVALLVIGLLLVAVRLADVRVYEQKELGRLNTHGITPLLFDLMYKRRILEIALDCVLITLAYYGAFWIRFEGLQPTDYQFYLDLFLKSVPIVLGLKLVSFLITGVYGGVWRYFSLSDLTAYLAGLALGSSLSVLGILYLFRFEHFSRGVFIIDAMLLTLLVLGSRISFRLLGEMARRGNENGTRVLIYGAGQGGSLLVRELLVNPGRGYVPVGFIDDDPSLRGHRVHGYAVLGAFADLATLIARHDIETIILSTDKLAERRLRDLEEICRESGTALVRLQFRLDRLVGAP